MLELIIIIVSVTIIVRRFKRKEPVSRHTPPISPPKSSHTPVFSQKDVIKQVNKQIYGTEKPLERVTVYNRLLLTDRYQNMEKIAHELGISKYQVLREIKELKKQGHYLQIEIDERNYRLIYPSSARTKVPVPAKSAKTVKPAPSASVSPRPSRSSVHTGECYEEWMSIPAGKRVVRCSYCGAENLISEKQDPHECNCYFCREEL